MRYAIENTTKRPQPVRTAEGLKRIGPGATEEHDVAPAHAKIYSVEGGPLRLKQLGETKEGGNGGQTALIDLTPEQRADIAEKEGIDLGGSDDPAEQVAIIESFRAKWEKGNADEVRAQAAAAGVDLEGVTTKRDVVNAWVAHEGVTVA